MAAAAVIRPLACKGLPHPADFEAIDKLAQTIAEKHAAALPVA